MDSIEKLIEHFRQFPGIGPRQARRFVYFLLSQPASVRANISREITELGKHIEMCAMCFRFFPVGQQSGAHGSKLCPICDSPARDHEKLLIVSRDADFETIEKSHVYNGLYFILGGSVPIMEKDPESRVRSAELVSRIEKKAPKEVILALNLTPEGEHTQSYIESVLAPYNTLKVSTLGRGLSTGLELEYSDSETIKNALKNRA